MQRGKVGREDVNGMGGSAWLPGWSTHLCRRGLVLVRIIA